MTNQDLEPKLEQPHRANHHIVAALGAMGAAMERVVGGSEEELPAGSRLLQYEDGTVVTEFTKGKFTLRELMDAINKDPIAVDMGPVLVRGTGKRPDGQLQKRFAYIGEDVLLSGIEDPENPGNLLFSRKRSSSLDEDAIDGSHEIEVGAAWDSPVGSFGRIDSVTIPYTRGVPEDRVQGGGPVSPLVQGREKIKEFKQGLN